MTAPRARFHGALLASATVLALAAAGTSAPATAGSPGRAPAARAAAPGIAATIAQAEQALRQRYGGFRVSAAASSVFGEWSGDRRPDILARDRAGGLFLYRGTGNVRSPYWPRQQIGRAWNAYNLLVRHGDWNSDGRQDILARDRAGVLWFYPGTGTGSSGHRARLRVGAGWGGYRMILGVDDWVGSSAPDLIAVDAAHRLWIYPGRGVYPGLFQARRQIGTGWGFTAVVSLSDMTGDGGAELLARDRTGKVYAYDSRNDPRSPYSRAELIGTGWNVFTLIACVGDLDAKGDPDLLLGDRAGDLFLLTSDDEEDETAEPLVGSNWDIYDTVF
jgi:hypothetical protein